MRSFSAFLMILLVATAIFIFIAQAAQYNPEIYEAQKVLSKRGYNPGPLDGMWGPATQRAIEWYQKDVGLPVTGRLDTLTKKQLGMNLSRLAVGPIIAEEAVGIPVKEQRLALVIGNDAYESAPLKNPANDARDMASVLRDLSFEVLERINVNERQMVAAIDDFYRGLRRADIGLFYFAGHGMQINGRNYLIPVGAHVTSETDVEFEAVEAGRVLGKMESAGNKLNIVVLDACRENPFKRSFRATQQGLAQMDAPKGTIIAYATSPGSTAADGIGRNGIYTKHLLQYMKRPDLSIQEVFMETGLGVMSETLDKQVPWLSSTPIPQFYLASSSATVDKPAENPQRQMLTVECNIRGAKVFVDDRLRGQTPVENVLLSPGEHTVVVEMPEYSPYKKRINVLAGRSISLYVELSHQSSPISAQQAITNNIGMNFVLIPAGQFIMGSPPYEPRRFDAENQHEVRISKPFYLQTTEVSQGQWKKVMGDNPSYFKDCGDECPVENVSWNDAQKFIIKLNQMEGTNRYRLPSEAEWEYACRAETTTAFATGDCISTDQANYNGNYPGKNCPKGRYPGKTVRVGSFDPNAWGVHDMHGNVWEWVEDDWHDDYKGAPDDGRAWIGESRSDGRVFRGGSWFSSARGCRSARRGSFPPGSHYSDLGFRLARSVTLGF